MQFGDNSQFVRQELEQGRLVSEGGSKSSTSTGTSSPIFILHLLLVLLGKGRDLNGLVKTQQWSSAQLPKFSVSAGKRYFLNSF